MCRSGISDGSPGSGRCCVHRVERVLDPLRHRVALERRVLQCLRRDPGDLQPPRQPAGRREETVDVAVLEPKVRNSSCERLWASAFARQMPLIPPAEVPAITSTTTRVRTLAIRLRQLLQEPRVHPLARRAGPRPAARRLERGPRPSRAGGTPSSPRACRSPATSPRSRRARAVTPACARRSPSGLRSPAHLPGDSGQANLVHGHRSPSWSSHVRAPFVRRDTSRRPRNLTHGQLAVKRARGLRLAGCRRGATPRGGAEYRPPRRPADAMSAAMSVSTARPASTRAAFAWRPRSLSSMRPSAGSISGSRDGARQAVSAATSSGVVARGGACSRGLRSRGGRAARPRPARARRRTGRRCAGRSRPACGRSRSS